MMAFLAQSLIYLLAAVLVVPLLKRLGLSSVLGYLGAGVLIGQPGLALVQDAEPVLHVAEIGVVLLMFIIGLELQPRRLWVMRHLVFGLGTAQVLVTALALSAVLFLLGLDGTTAALLGFALALSSTAFVLQLLGEQKKLYRPHGRAAFGTLLLQDLAVIPAIAAVNLLSTRGPSEAAPALQPGLILAVVLGAAALRYLLSPLLRYVAASGIRELFTAASLALVAGTALAMGQAGLSMGLGAFLAGLMVAGSEYRHQLEADVEPFKGLLLGLFFIAVGMNVNLGQLLSEPASIAALTLALIAIKAALMMPLAHWSGLDWRESVRTGLVLSQGGEFSFVLLAAAAGTGLVAGDLAQTAVLVVTLSMAATPIAVAAGERFLRQSDGEARSFDQIDPEQPPVVVAGFGRVGQIVARVLVMRHIPFTALEINPHHVDFVRQFGNKVFYGDATRVDVLHAAGVREARALVVAVGDLDGSLKIVEEARATCPGVAILARASTRRHELLLRELGVNYVLRDTLHSSLRLARALLEQLGATGEDAMEAVAAFEAHDARTLAQQAAVFRDDAAFLEATLSAQTELEHLFEADEQADSQLAPTADPDGRVRA